MRFASVFDSAEASFAPPPPLARDLLLDRQATNQVFKATFDSEPGAVGSSSDLSDYTVSITLRLSGYETTSILFIERIRKIPCLSFHLVKAINRHGELARTNQRSHHRDDWFSFGQAS
ncbi:hypothetical protein Pla52n_68940 [Stieleria varia]|uniref:Uncharacterized protein n=1 Tax=Stieleria varia TaxID=2528005 RepID=A0A5C5ZQT6_9BACT|nr:hypothetical protein Pla52n_68940 [Stieleria varia]